MPYKKIVFLFTFLFALHAPAQVKEMFGITFPNSYKKITMSRPSACGSTGWKLVFEDEFEGNEADAGKWFFTPPWGSMFFFADKNRCDSSQNGACDCADPRNVTVDSGRLKIFIRKENIVSQTSFDKTDTAIQPDGLPCKRICQFSSGCIYSKQKFNAGKFEIRCKIPRIDGVWPAFWLYGDCGQELDVFEFLNERYAEKEEDCNRHLHMTYHREAECGNSKTWCSHGTTRVDTIDYSKSFHTFSVEWDEYQVTWKVDGEVRKVLYGLKKLYSGKAVDECRTKEGKKYRLYSVMPEFKPMSIIVSCAVTNYCNALHPLTRGTYPAVFEVDYVRAWERE